MWNIKGARGFWIDDNDWINQMLGLDEHFNPLDQGPSCKAFLNAVKEISPTNTSPTLLFIGINKHLLDPNQTHDPAVNYRNAITTFLEAAKGTFGFQVQALFAIEKEAWLDHDWDSTTNLEQSLEELWKKPLLRFQNLNQNSPNKQFNAAHYDIEPSRHPIYKTPENYPQDFSPPDAEPNQRARARGVVLIFFKIG